MKKVFIGVDPGANGAMAILEDGKPPVLVACDYDEYGVEASMLNSAAFDLDGEQVVQVYAVVEDVHAMPMNGCKGNFMLGWSLGRIEQALCGKPAVKYQLVKPQQWQREYGISNKDKSKSQSIATAKRLFPGVDLRRTPKCTKDHDGFADALLMAEYARRHMA